MLVGLSIKAKWYGLETRAGGGRAGIVGKLLEEVHIGSKAHASGMDSIAPSSPIFPTGFT